MIYFCCDPLRRNLLAGSAFNGIDYLDVLDHEIALSDPDNRQKKLVVHFINDLAANPLGVTNIQIEGGERIRNIIAAGVAVDSTDPKALHVDVDKYGDFSLYTLRLVQNPQDPAPPVGIDPLFAAVDFSFKVDCPTDFDCRPQRDCPPAARQEPEIDYLAKDFGSFRRLMLDRMSSLMPQWQERNPADLGIALVETLAYVGDQLSYQQDAVATEAYLGTARRRVSVRRHARLVDYAVHDGCNSRAWMQIQVQGQSGIVMETGTQLFTRIPGEPPALPDDPTVRARAHEVFETMDEVVLFEAHNKMNFYSWGDQRCCLPKGSTHATLRGAMPNLKAGDVLIFEEVVGPNTGYDTISGQPIDANPANRCAIRLTHVQTLAASGQPLTDPLTGQTISEIFWADEDALPFPLCISAQTDSDHGAQFIADVSVARGNIVLADHGKTTGESLGSVPEGPRARPDASECDRCKPQDPIARPVRYQPLLSGRPLTFAEPSATDPMFSFTSDAQDASDLDGKILPLDLHKRLEAIGFPGGASIQGQDPIWSISNGRRALIVKEEQGKLAVYSLPRSAGAAMAQDPRNALPAARLHSTLNLDEIEWVPVRDLLDSSATDAHFVVEIEGDATARVRFGDARLGARPEALSTFDATYRVGNGAAGNVGAEAIAHLFTNNALLRAATLGVRNPLAAEGGIEPETTAEVRAYAPTAFRTQERAVTEADYAAVTERHSGVQRAIATFRWTGSWHTVFITVDRWGGLPMDDDFETVIRSHVERYRMAGHDLEIDGPRYVSLEIDIYVCAAPEYFRAHVKEALLRLFSNRVLADGSLGMFHPDRFTFGQTVYLSPLIAAAQATPGVLSVQVNQFQRHGIPDDKPLSAGRIDLGRLEIARCDNDPNFAEHGVFNLSVGGGK